MEEQVLDNSNNLLKKIEPPSYENYLPASGKICLSGIVVDNNYGTLPGNKICDRGECQFAEKWKRKLLLMILGSEWKWYCNHNRFR